MYLTKKLIKKCNLFSANLRILFEEVYGRIRGHSLSTFWSDVLESTELLDLTDENNFIKKLPKKYKVYQTASDRTIDNSNNSFCVDLETSTIQTKNPCPKKCESRTVSEVDLSSSVIKENDQMDIRISDSSEKPTNSIQECLKVDKLNLNSNNSSNCGIIVKSDIRIEDNSDNNVISSEKLPTADIQNLDGSKTKENDTGVANINSSLLSEDNITTNVDVSKLSIVQETEILIDKSSSDNRTVLTINEANECVDSQSIDVSENDEQAKTKSPANLESLIQEGFEISAGIVEQGELETLKSMDTIEEAIEKTSEEIALAEEERLKEEERIRIEKEKLEAEEKIRKEAEEKKRLEEERIRVIEEAKKLEKQMKEAEYYEAMLKEEEERHKVSLFDEAPIKRKKNSGNCTLKIEAEDLELFCLGRQNGTQDYIGQRVLQVIFYFFIYFFLIYENLNYSDRKQRINIL